MKKCEKINPIQGKRLKECIKNSKLTQKELSKITPYTVQHINNIANSRRSMTREAAHIFAEKLHVDEDYLLGTSEYKTSEEMHSFIKSKGMQDMSAVLNYLESIGLKLKPINSLECPLTSLYKNIDILSPYIDPSSLEQLKQKYDFTLDTKDFYKKYYFEYCSVKLSSMLPDAPFLKTNDLTKGSLTLPPSDYALGNIYSGSNNIIKENYDISIYFEVYYKGDLVKTLSEHELQNFIKILDSYSICTIENILLK